MPPFDPVRDAVLNSPIARSHPLPSPFTRLEISTSLPSPSLSSPSPSLSKRATDLSVLLNSDSQEPPIRTPVQNRSSALSHILLNDDHADDRLATVEPLQRSGLSGNRTQDSSRQSVRRVEQRSSHEPNLRTHSTPPRSDKASPIPRSPGFSAASRPSSSSSSGPSSSNTITPRTTSSPVMAPPPSTLPYNPRRITPAASVLIPMSQEEMNMFKNYCGKGAQLLRKRKRERSSEPDASEHRPNKRLAGDVGVVVEHYNARPDVGVVQRLESPIIGLKAFNNWIKSVLITRFAHPVLAASPSSRSGAGRGPRIGSGKVLDMGCGKGGDLTKWSKARIKELLAVDIADVSVEQARGRWETMRRPRFDATFAALDCYTESISKAFSPEKLSQPLDVVSLQFCMHYAFESERKARCMLDNVSRWLRPGGVFIGTIPNAEQLLDHLDALPPDAEDLSFGNSVYKIRFEDRQQKPIFGHRYWFYLQDAVENVPEYVVRWDNFVQLASEYDLHPVYKEEFHEVFDEHKEHPEFKPLMVRMKVVDENGESSMDESQWEAANIYIAFAFEKSESSRSSFRH